MIDAKDLLEKLTDEDIIVIMRYLGADRHQDGAKYIIFPTICHNLDTTSASMKLYYYKNTGLFRCYTECNEAFNLYNLFEKRYKLIGKSYLFVEVLSLIVDITHISSIKSMQKTDFDRYGYTKHQSYQSRITPELPQYDEGILTIFDHVYPEQWLEEGISKEAIDEYGVKFSNAQNKIVLPHYDVNGNLIGIRGRAIDPIEIEGFGKYKPITIERLMYTHSLGLNLYGLNLAKEDIKQSHYAILVEGEKSCLKYFTYFGRHLCVAVCGDKLNKYQIDLLIQHCNPQEIIIAFDKEFIQHNTKEGEHYFEKLYQLPDKYKSYCAFSFIHDVRNLLNKKDSPLDRGKDVFLQLLQERVKL